LYTESEALHTVKHNVTQKKLKALNKQSREAGMQQEQNVLVTVLQISVSGLGPPNPTGLSSDIWPWMSRLALIPL